MKSIKLSSGHEMPVLGLGTWQMKGKECKEAVKAAIKLGYNHIDTAYVYDNQKKIAQAIKKSKLERNKLFITSKVWTEDLKYEDFLKQAEIILKELQLDYLDLLLIHWPNRNISMEESFKAFKTLHKQGKVKSIGVSNFTINHLKKAIKVSSLPISVNQVEFNPYLNQDELLKFCKKNNIVITAYCPLSRGNLLEDPVLKEIAEIHKKTPAQITLRWIIQKEMIAIPKSRNESRIKENMEIFNFKLTDEEITKINKLNKDLRNCNPGFAEFDS